MSLEKVESMVSSSGINIDYTMTHIEEAIIFGAEIEELKEKIADLRVSPRFVRKYTVRKFMCHRLRIKVVTN